MHVHGCWLALSKGRTCLLVSAFNNNDILLEVMIAIDTLRLYYWICDLISGMQNKVVAPSQMLAFHRLTYELASGNQRCCDYSCHRTGWRCVVEYYRIGLTE